LKFPITLQDLPWVSSEAVKELDDDDFGISLESVFDHAPVFYPVIAPSRHHVSKLAHG
jgi:hypothetical protein